MYEVIRLSPEEVEAFWAEMEKQYPGIRARLAARDNGKKPSMTWEQRWQMAIEAGISIVMRKAREEGMRLA